MKPILCCLFLLLSVACSSVTAEGSYTVTSARKSGTCSGTTGAGTTWTISDSGDGDAFTLQFPGVSGGCRLLSVGGDATKLQGKCTILVGDATTADDAITAQYSLDFVSDGFSGTSAVHLPPAKSAPTGCDGVLAITGKRL